VYAVLPATGTLIGAAVDRDDCGLSVDVGGPGDRFGTPVQDGGYVLVPNRSTGHVVVVDAGAGQVVADLAVAGAGSGLELVAKDGVVFYNDLTSEKAGVLRLDGQRWGIGKQLRKFAPGRAGEGILTPAGNKGSGGAGGDRAGQKGTGAGAGKPRGQRPGDRTPKPPNSQQDPTQQPPDQQNPGQSGAPAPDQRQPDSGQPDSGQPDSGQQNPGQQDPGQQDPGQQPGPTDPGQQPGPTDPGSSDPPPPASPVINAITVSPGVVVRDKPATFAADVTNTEGATWTWTVRDPATGSVLHTDATPNGFDFTVPVGSATNLEVELQVHTDAGDADRTQAFTTTNDQAPQIDSLTVNPGTPGVGQEAVLSADERVAAGRGTWTWKITGGGQAPFTTTTGPGDLRHTFDAVGSYTVELTVSFDGNSDTRQLPVSVVDGADVAAGDGNPVDMRDRGGRTIQVRVTGSFVSQQVAVTAESWITLSAATVTVPAGGTATVTAQVTGTPPADGTVADAIRFRLGNGKQAGVAVVANAPPVITGSRCARVTRTAIVFFGVNTDDSVVSATVHVGDTVINLTANRADPNDGTPFDFGGTDSFRNAPAEVWSAIVTDQFGLTTELPPQPRTGCF
jgi:hypothetical protein